MVDLLGVNSSSFVPHMFGEVLSPLRSPYNLLLSGQRHIMESTSVGALIGSVLAIFIMHHVSRKKLQTSGFLILGTMFVIVGALYVTLEGTRAHVVAIVFYGICQLFFNLGVPRINFLGGNMLISLCRAKYDYIHC